MSAAAATMVLPVHRLTPYLRLRIRTDDRSMALDHRPSLFGLIPLWRRRIELPLTELASARTVRNVRWQCLVAAAALAASVFLLDVPTTVGVLLGILAVVEVPLALGPGKAVRLERTDGRSWTIPFCRTHAFDASLAMEDAERRRDAITRAEGPPRATALYLPPAWGKPRVSGPPTAGR